MGRGDYCRWKAKSTTLDYLSIKIADMNRYKVFSPGWHSWQWSRNGKHIGSISFTVTDEAVIFRYSTKDTQGDLLDVNKAIRFARTPCNFGGQRKWFLCGCGKRVARLFFRRQHIACRHCFNLAYPTQNGDECDRAWARITKLEARLKDDRYRPKGMHWKTFWRIREMLEESIYRKDLAIVEIGRRRFPWMQL